MCVCACITRSRGFARNMWLCLLVTVTVCSVPLSVAQLLKSYGGYHWGTWSSLPLTCSVTCGRGLRCRVRKCLDAFGKVEPSTERCSNPEDYESKAESCTICVVQSRCPNVAGWSEWSSWSLCRPRDAIHQRSTTACQEGVRTRNRLCNNPPPEPPPFGIPCVGPSSQTSNCSYNCEDSVIYDGGNIVQQIHLQFEKDYIKGLKGITHVLRKHTGQYVRMSCDTPAYRLAKRLTTASEFTAARRALKNKVLRVLWYKNGKLVNIINPHSKVTPLKSRPLNSEFGATDPLLYEEYRWEQLLSTSLPQLDDSDLVLTRLQEGDSGFYTCELAYDQFRWSVVFYSLIIVGVKYSAQVTDPFYLHSNLGFSNALDGVPVWFEASQIIWTLNGVEYSRGIAARLSRRIQQIKRLNVSHRGFWQCFLLVPAVGPISILNSPKQRVARRISLSEFQLIVPTEDNRLWQLAEHPKSMRFLRNLSVSLWMICQLLVLFLLLTIWAAKRWITRSLAADQKKAVVQEILDNHCRLMLIARKRASINKERLFPLILQEHQRLERANRHLASRLKETDILEEDDEGGKEGKLSLLGRSAASVSKLIHGMSTLLSKRSPQKVQRRSVGKLSKVSALSIKMEQSTKLRDILANRVTKAPGNVLSRRGHSTTTSGRHTRCQSEATRSRISIASTFGRLSGISSISFGSQTSDKRQPDIVPPHFNFGQRGNIRARSEGPITAEGLRNVTRQ